MAYPAAEVARVEAHEDDGRLDLSAVHDAAIAYGVPIAPDAQFESATLITERQAHASAAAERAEELRQEALRRADDVEASRQRADDAARDARALSESSATPSGRLRLPATRLSVRPTTLHHRSVVERSARGARDNAQSRRRSSATSTPPVSLPQVEEWSRV